MAKTMVLHDKVKEVIGDQKVLGFVTGFGLIRKLTPTFVVTENGVLLYDPKMIGEKKVSIPFAQILGAKYGLPRWGIPQLGIITQSGTTFLLLSGSVRKTHPRALEVFQILRDKLSELAGVPISESHNKGLGKEVWAFNAPAKVSTIDAKASKTEASITDQIQKLADLRDAGILTSEEFENKKKELLTRI